MYRLRFDTKYAIRYIPNLKQTVRSNKIPLTLTVALSMSITYTYDSGWRT